MKKIFLSNILIIILILIIFELIAFSIHAKEDFREIKILYKKSYLQSIFITFNNYYNPKAYNKLYYRDSELRSPIIRDIKDNRNILIYGCSYMHGYTLDEKETFPHYIAKYINYNIYNYGLSGGGLREFLYLLNNIKEQDNTTKYVLYTFMKHHKKRLFCNFRPKVPFFLKYKNRLIYLKYNPFFSSALLFYFQSYIYHHTENIREKEDILLTTYFKEANKKIKEKFPNAQFVILVYDTPDYQKETNSIIWKNLENEGIKIIKVEDITDIEDIYAPKYTLPNDFHPNSKTWSIITPALLKELNLI